MNDSFKQAAHRLLPLIESALEGYLPAGKASDRLTEAMRYSLLSPGKRIRPLLVLLSCEAAGGDAETAMPAACAVEMVHAFSLIHDDLPGMDNDDLRRGKPTNHKVYGEAEAILAGDALLAQSFTVLCEIEEPEKAMRCVRILAQATGMRGMCAGQSLDMRGASAQYSRAEIEALHRLKTGALIRASAILGALMGDAKPEREKALALYGERIGLLFQVTDDLLDGGDSARLGKTAGKDEAQHKQTFVQLLGTEECRRYASALTQEALETLDVFGTEADALRSLAIKIRDRDH
jgi:geranylgeranyl diphosphate synthase, type II